MSREVFKSGKDYREFYEKESNRQKIMYGKRPESYTYNRIKKIVETYIQTLSINSLLDVGCAEGAYVRFAEDNNISVIGLDVALTKLENAKDMRLSDYILSSSESLPFEDSSFEGVISLETLEHVLDPQTMMEELFRVSRRYVVISIPVGESVGGGHVNFFSKEEIKTWSSWGLVEVKGVLTHFMPFRMTLAFSSFKTHRFISFFDSLFGRLPWFRFSGTHVVLLFDKNICIQI